MKFNRYLICALFLVLICCIGAASAADADDVVAADDAIDEEVTEAVDVSDEIDEESLGVSEEPALSDGETPSTSEKVIYVGQNKTVDGGNGSYENPFATLDLACSDVNSFKDSVTVNIFEGTYYMTPNLLFNTSNLNIVGVNSSIVLKNSECIPGSSSGPGSLISFGLASGSGNFTMTNVIFDSSEWNLNNGYLCYFVPCACDNSIIIFNNCTFSGYTTEILNPDQKNVEYLFNQCKFVNFDALRIGDDENGNVKFQYCIITAGFDQYGLDLSYANSITFDGIWWGQNSITKSYFYKTNGKPRYKNANYIFNKFAIFNVSENYLGNNQYEIIGKLMWNDTTDDDIDKLGPMTVTLSSSTGDLPETAILQDGTFRVIYTSTASTHDVTAKLDNEIITLNFNTTDMAVNVSDIIIGQDQNITVTLPQDFNGTLSIKVNNKTYNTTVDNTNSITYKIPDVLPAGKHVIDVIFADEKNHIYGFNSTNITVSKVSDYDFNATVTPTVYLGDNATVTLSLPSGATGNVTVKVGDNEAETFNVNDIISIDGFVAGNNVVNIIYNGNDVYDAKSVVKNISALNKPTITIPEIDAGKATTTTITLPENATGNVTVFVDGKEYSVVPLTNGSATVTIPELPAGKHNVTISYSGDGNYSGFAQTSAVEVKEPVKPTPKPDDKKPVTVKKTATKITAKKKTFKAKTKVKKYTITLKAGKKAVKKVQVILKIGKKTYKAKTNAKGKATFKIKKLTKKGKYTAKIIFKGNKLYKATTKKVKITVKK